MDIIDITLFIISCGRPNLLKTTIESFIKYNTYPIKECIIIEGMKYVKTEYVFHCEDVWEFLKSGFIEKSIEILRSK